MMSRTHIRQFLAVVDTGSFTRAALQINVAQPTLSAGIAELERRLGSRLFARSNRRVQLTEAGNRLLSHARAIEREFQLAEQSVTGIAAPVQPVRLGVLSTLSTRMIEAIVSVCPMIELVEGSERELTAGLANGRLDLALTLLRAGETRFAREALFSEGYRLALPETHRLADRESVTAEEVAGETMIARRSCEVLGETSRFFTERGVRPPFGMRSTNDDKVMAMVRAGLGITVAPESLGIPGVAMPNLAGFETKREIGLLFAAHWGGDHALVHAIRTCAPGLRTDGQAQGIAEGRAAS